MIFVVSGEGPSDIGVCRNGHGECSGNDLKPGPMAAVVDKLVEPIAGFAPLASGAVEFVSEGRRLELTKELPNSFLVGKKRDFQSGYYFKEARALASLAKRKSATDRCPVAVVLFRDADGTRSSERGLADLKSKSIEDGFRAEGFDLGVPMVPKPKSEAWLLCALKTEPYQHCANLEDALSGNDNSPSPAKVQLAERIGALGRGIDDLADMIADGTISPSRIDMPSFNRFRTRLEEVTNRMLGRQTSAQQN